MNNSLFYDDLSEIEEKGTLVTKSYLNFVDLAGSEKVSNHTNIMTTKMK